MILEIIPRNAGICRILKRGFKNSSLNLMVFASSQGLVFSIFVPNFALKFAPNFPQICWGLFVLCFLGNGHHWKFTKKRTPCFNSKSQTIHTCFLEAGKVTGEFDRAKEGVEKMVVFQHVISCPKILEFTSNRTIRAPPRQKLSWTSQL